MKVAGKIIIRPMGEYDAATTYGILDMVTIDNKLYVARKNGLFGIDPVTDNDVNWRMLIDGSADLKEFEAAINQQITTLESNVDQQVTAVNDKVDNIQVGGRNLVRHSYITNANCTTFTYDEATNTWDCVAPMGNAANKCGFRIVSNNAIKIPRGRTFIVSLEVKSDVDVPWRCDVNNRFDGYTSETNDNDDQTKRKTSSTSLVAGRWTKVWFSYTAKEDADYDLHDANSFWSIVTTDCEADVHFQFRNVMGELATIPSEYTPAPEDITSDIAMAQSTADSAQTDANTAKSMANNASQGANAAISDAANALSKAQEALDKAAALEEKINNLTMTINTTTGNLEWRME